MMEVVNGSCPSPAPSTSASANRRLFQAYQSWQNQKFGESQSDPRVNLVSLFSSCEASKLIPKLVQLPWNPSEQECLVDYLLNISNAKSAKLQAILCLLLNGNLDQAQRHKDFCLSSASSDDDDDLFQSGMLISALIESFVKNFPHSSTSSKSQATTQDPGTPRHEKFHSVQDTQTPFTDSSIMNESVRRRRSRKTKDQTPMPSHPMLTRSTKKKSLGQH